ncbi:MAG: RNA polymerase sigma factor [Gemmataceae bacterium]
MGPNFSGLKTPWVEFYRFQTERLSRIAAKMRVPPDQIEEVVQEVWLDAVNHREGFLGEDAEKRLASWLDIVVRNKSTDAIRRLNRQQAESLDKLPEEPVDRGSKEPSELMEAKERGEKITELVEELRKEDPLNCLLTWERIVEDRSVGDMAEETGLGCHAISCRINRTLSHLRVRLRELSERKLVD